MGIVGFEGRGSRFGGEVHGVLEDAFVLSVPAVASIEVLVTDSTEVALDGVACTKAAAALAPAGSRCCVGPHVGRGSGSAWRDHDRFTAPGVTRWVV